MARPRAGGQDRPAHGARFFRMSTTRLYGRRGLPTATWYKKRSQTHRHAPYSPVSAAVDPAWNEKRLGNLQGDRQQFSKLPSVNSRRAGPRVRPSCTIPPRDRAAARRKDRSALSASSCRPTHPTSSSTSATIPIRTSAIPPGAAHQKHGNGSKDITWPRKRRSTAWRAQLIVTEEGATQGMPRSTAISMRRRRFFPGAGDTARRGPGMDSCPADRPGAPPPGRVARGRKIRYRDIQASRAKSHLAHLVRHRQRAVNYTRYTNSTAHSWRTPPPPAVLSDHRGCAISARRCASTTAGGHAQASLR